jgi:hypothetical protein
MKEYNATREASLVGGQVMILEGLFEILDTTVSMDLEVGTPAFDAGMKELAKLEAQIEALTQRRDFLWSLA